MIVHACKTAHACVRCECVLVRVRVCLISGAPLPFPPPPALWAAAGAENKHATKMFKIQGQEKNEHVSNQTANQQGNSPCLDTCDAYFTYSLPIEISAVIPLQFAIEMSEFDIGALLCEGTAY